MASEHIIVQIIDDTRLTPSESAPSPDLSADKHSPEPEMKKPKKKDKDDEKSVRKQLTVMFAKEAEEAVVKTADDIANGWYNIEEDYTGQTSYQNAKKIIGLGVAIGKGAYAVATATSTLEVVGAAIGIATVVANFGISAFKTVASEYVDLDKTAYSQYYNTERYGLINGSMGTEN